MMHTHIYVWDRLILSVGPGRAFSSHHHFGSILVVAPDAPMTLTSGASPPVVTQAAVVAPNAWHSLDCLDTRVATIVVGPDHPWFCYIKPLLKGAAIVPLDLAALDGSAIAWDELFEGRMDCATARQITQRVLETYGGSQVPPHRLDARISAVLRILDEAVTSTTKPAELGRLVGLSGSTLMRRFKAELGVRMREYVLWRRLMVALTLVDGRSTIAEIAQRTGFYDQAHLTRTVRRMVELAPSFFTDLAQTRVHICAVSTVAECES